MNSTKKIFLKITAAIFLTVLLISCGNKDDRSNSENTGAPVKITEPQKMNLTEYITLNATTVFLKKEIVRATFQGFIEKIYKNIGDQISSGDLLLEIKTKESAADDNLQVPFGNKIFKGTIQIKASSNGVLTELNYNTGDFVSDGEQIAVISNPSSMRINLNVPFQYSNKIKINTLCEIYLPNGKVVNASIQRIIPKVDLSAQTQTYILEMKQFENLPENLNVNAKIPLRAVIDATVLLKSAVLTNETLDKFWVMKLANDTTAIRVNITKGIENDSFVQIMKPELKPTDRIISEGAFGLPDTAKVVIEK
ncbi:MAG: HlyD family efflux transporter periplasmic adaptor subunit [Ignavibacteriales bacterium]|nr:HlyD family efflux transporter periplasmic adaptor subunit [Ignavibacteriales bacterium]